MASTTRDTRAAFVLVVAALLATSCSDGGSSSGGAASAAAELRASGYGDFLGVQQPNRSTSRPGWTELYFDAAAEQAICLDGSDFQVSVRHGTSDRVLLYLQGGGACWDHESCWVTERALMRAIGPIEAGALRLDDPASPFRDDDIVYVPYCDGALFGADTTVDYDGVRTFHHGLRNLSVAVDALKREFPDPSQIVVAGSSAGAFGNIPGYAVTRVAFPDTPIIVLNDSGPGIENHAAVPAAQQRADHWRLADRYPPSCADCQRQPLYLLDWAMERDPSLRVGMLGYQRDLVIMSFFELDAEGYLDLVLSLTDDIRARHPGRLQRYFAAGAGHTTLLYQQFYEQSVNGVALTDWTRAFLDDSDAWVDVIE